MLTISLHVQRRRGLRHAFACLLLCVMRAPKDPVTTLKGLLGCLRLQKGKSKKRLLCNALRVKSLLLFAMHSVELRKGSTADSFSWAFLWNLAENHSPSKGKWHWEWMFLEGNHIDSMTQVLLDKTSLACCDALAGQNAGNFVRKFRLQEAILFKSRPVFHLPSESAYVVSPCIATSSNKHERCRRLAKAQENWPNKQARQAWQAWQAWVERRMDQLATCLVKACKEIIWGFWSSSTQLGTEAPRGSHAVEKTFERQVCRAHWHMESLFAPQSWPSFDRFSDPTKSTKGSFQSLVNGTYQCRWDRSAPGGSGWRALVKGGCRGVRAWPVWASAQRSCAQGFCKLCRESTGSLLLARQWSRCSRRKDSKVSKISKVSFPNVKGLGHFERKARMLRLFPRPKLLQQAGQGSCFGSWKWKRWKRCEFTIFPSQPICSCSSCVALACLRWMDSLVIRSI